MHSVEGKGAEVDAALLTESILQFEHSSESELVVLNWTIQAC